MKRLTLKIVFSGLVIACRRATWPTSRSPVLGLTATTDGVKRLPSAFSSTVGSPASMIATTELVVPRSMPRTFAIVPLHLYQNRSCAYVCVLGSLERPDGCERGPQWSLDAAPQRLEILRFIDGRPQFEQSLG